MCFIKKPIPSLIEYDNWVRLQVGDIPRFQTTWNQVKDNLAELGIECMIKDAPDTNVFYTDEATLTKMTKFLVYPADYYVWDLEIDCDDYAMWAASDARRIFKVNGIYQAWGNMPLGYHAFSLGLVGENRYKLWDANAGFLYAGELFSRGDNGYLPDKYK